MMKKQPTGRGGAAREGLEWEMRPGGMLVQKRNGNLPQQSACSLSSSYSSLTSYIHVRVKFNSFFHVINISSHSTFDELKKMLAGPTGLHPGNQRLMYKDKEITDTKQNLATVGIRNGSRILLLTTKTTSHENNVATDALKCVAKVAMDVDKLARQVKNIEGGIAQEKELSSLTEKLMSQLIKLDGVVIVAHGSDTARLTRKRQVIRVQRYIERLDRLRAAAGGGQKQLTL